MKWFVAVCANRHLPGALHFQLSYKRLAADLFSVEIERDLFSVESSGNVMPLLSLEQAPFRVMQCRGGELPATVSVECNLAVIDQ